MALYEVGVRGGAGTVNVAQAELRAGAGDPIYVREIGIFLSAATASVIGIGRPAVLGVGGTATALQANVQDDPAANGSVITTGWTTAPTAPTVYLRRVGITGAIGNGVIFSWGERGLRVKQGTSIVVFNIAASAIADIYFVVEE